jgi:hypothetical protein
VKELIDEDLQNWRKCLGKCQTSLGIGQKKGSYPVTVKTVCENMSRILASEHDPGKPGTNGRVP